MQKILVFCMSLFLLTAVEGQSQQLWIQQDGGKLYLDHTVVAKENWYSVGRMYNISPKEIAPFNQTGMEQPLSIGQKLRIPLTEANLSTQGSPAGDEAYIPLYHKVKEKETLYRISLTYNKVSVEQLRSWNKLKGNETSAGAPFIVGFLRVKKESSPLAGGSVTPPPAVSVAPAPAAAETPAQVKNEAAAPSVSTSSGTVKAPVSSGQTTVAEWTAARTLPVAPGTEGAFAGLYADYMKGRKSKSVTGLSSYFKSTSGWKDGRYYVLVNGIPPGSIVKLTASANGRVAYAKVLGEVPPGKESEGLLCRISSAGLAQLQLAEGKHDVVIEY